MRLNTIYESQDVLWNQAAKLIQKTFGITLDPIPIEFTSEGNFSHHNDGIVYLRVGMNQNQALRELIHELGHNVFERSNQREWLKVLSSIDIWPEHFGMTQANETFARIFEATVLNDKLEPVWHSAQIHMKKIL